MKFIATGDTIVTCPYTRNYEGYQELVDFIRSMDVRMNNMENPLADGNVIKAAALPLGLGFNDPKETKGFPRIANAEETELLYQQLKNTCEPYGTKVTIDEDGLLVFTRIEEAV